MMLLYVDEFECQNSKIEGFMGVLEVVVKQPKKKDSAENN
mgnify:FL=1